MADLQSRVASRQLEVVGLRLKAAGAAGLKLSLAREIKEATKPLIEEVRKAAERDLPKSGGLNDWISKGKFTSTTRFTGPQLGIRIKRSGQFNRATNSFRHPVFGHRDRWVSQPISMEWFYATLDHYAPLVTTPRVLLALKETQTALMTPL